MEKIVGKIVYDRDSKRYHRYLVEGEEIVGTIYLTKGAAKVKQYQITLVPLTEEEGIVQKQF
ncbi:hypothetical protein J7J18_01750 [bacterium]|nr:hypothetical protein [bacterium]